jgi:hypothetical protein
MNETYMVVSVRELNNYLKLARHLAHAAGKSGRKVSNHCILVRGLGIHNMSGGTQIQLPVVQRGNRGLCTGSVL